MKPLGPYTIAALHDAHENGTTRCSKIGALLKLEPRQAQKVIGGCLRTDTLKMVGKSPEPGRKVGVYEITNTGREAIGVPIVVAVVKQRHTTLGQAFTGVTMRSDRPGAWDASKVQSVGLLSDRANEWGGRV
jgi:hypothetical protein